MSAPPPAFPPQAAENPDRRPLPEGYISRYDERYAAWYYVDTRAQPPRSSWQHPQGPPPTSPQPSTNYSPPPNPPPNRPYNSGGPSFPGQYSGPQYNQTSPYPSGYEGGQPDQRNFPGSQQYPTQGYSGYPGQGWQQPQQGQVYTQPQQRRHGFGRGGGGGLGGGGMGTALLAGGGGLVAGALIGEAFEHHEEREREEAYDQGYDDGQDNDYGGGDFGGGDW